LEGRAQRADRGGRRVVLHVYARNPVGSGRSGWSLL